MAIGSAPPRSTASHVELALDAQKVAEGKVSLRKSLLTQTITESGASDTIPPSPDFNCELATSPIIQERRSRHRYCIVQPVRYALSNCNDCIWTGVGTILNISSAGVCFTTESSLSP